MTKRLLRSARNDALKADYAISMSLSGHFCLEKRMDIE
jgi:hypothetical protein